MNHFENHKCFMIPKNAANIVVISINMYKYSR